MFSMKSSSVILFSSLGLLIYSAWLMLNNILPSLQIFKVVYETFFKAIDAFKLQSSQSMSNLQFLIYVVVLVVFVLLLAKFWKFAIYALLFIVFVLVCNFAYYAWSTGATATEWFTFTVMSVSALNVFATSKSGGLF